MNSSQRVKLSESFGFRLLRAFIAVIIILLALLTSYSIYHEYQKEKEHRLYDGGILAGLLGHSSKTGIFAENREMLKSISDGILDHHDIITVSVYNAGLEELYTATKTGDGKFAGRNTSDFNRDIAGTLNRPGSLKVVETKTAFEFIRPVFMEIVSNTEEALYFSVKEPLKENKKIGYVRIVYDKNRLHREMISIIVRHALTALIFICFSFVIIYFAVRKITTPLAKLTEEVRRFGKEGEIEEISVGTKDEIGRLASVFQEMAEDLKKREEEKKTLEEHLAQSKRMEAIGTLARGIAHDFNNILSIIKGAVFVLIKKTGDDSNLQKYAEVIDNSIHRARELIRSLLVFSITDKIQMDALDLNAFIREEYLKITGIHKSIEYALSLSDNHLIIIADRLKMEQVFINIISNAVDAMPEGGRIHIKTEAVHISPDDTQKETAKRPGDYACMTISDTGTGMEVKTKERIFEPFFTTKETGKGTGLGLSIVYGIMADHKGYIEVRTGEGKGTIFRLYLPLAG